jgi:hypothetical protein
MGGPMNQKRAIAVQAAFDFIGSAAVGRLARAAEEAREPFLKAGRHGGRMERFAKDAMVEEFRAVARDMVAKPREYDPENATAYAEQLEKQLTSLIETIFGDRRTALQSPSTSARPHWLDPLLTEFKQALLGEKDDAVRDLEFQQLLESGPGVYIAVSNSQGPLAIAAGAGNTITQAVKGQSVKDLTAMLDQVRALVASSDLDEGGRIEILDQVDLLAHEASKPAPDNNKLVRWVKRLAETGEKVAVAAVPKLLESWLKAHGL